MRSLLTVLWISAPKDFAAELVAEAPALDVVWEDDFEAAARYPLHGFDALLIDGLSAEATLSGLARLALRGALPPILVRLTPGTANERGELLAAGVAEVLLSALDSAPGVRHTELLAALDRVGRREARPSARREKAPVPRGIVADSPQMQEVFELVARAGASRVTVLISGETGTGKELVARAIHRASTRRARPCVAVNCAAFPDTLLESELFGHERGSFTGAERDKAGLFEEADGGTLFLDEVGETSRSFQAKLLRVLQEGEVRRVGGGRARRVDARIVAATNRDLWQGVVGGEFREDLYFRLAVFPIHVPPLRERPRDLLPLIDHFLALHGEREDKRGVTLSPEAAALLQAHRWPGNVRELENEIQRALALTEARTSLLPEHFSQRLSGVLEPVRAHVHPGETLRESMGRIEAWLIRRALDAHGGRRAETARGLAITREGLYKKMKRLGIE